MLIGLVGYIVSLALLINMPERNIGLLLVATLIEAFSAALLGPNNRPIQDVNARPVLR
jgi:hypothetical protein